jgi:hypothetical protein
MKRMNKNHESIGSLRKGDEVVSNNWYAWKRMIKKRRNRKGSQSCRLEARERHIQHANLRLTCVSLGHLQSHTSSPFEQKEKLLVR